MFPGKDETDLDAEAAPNPSTDSAPSAPFSHASPEMFVCPGSETPISRSVHLSRLRRGYEECAHCIHRELVGHLSSAATRALAANSLLQSDGLQGGAIRGVYLNELTRPVMAGLAEAVASLLWDDLGSLRELSEKPCPVVVVGRDTRPMSADLAAGAVAGLRRMGCHVIEINEVTRPEFWFAARHLESFAGLWINGVGTDANCSGLDIVQGGRCWSTPGRLDDLMTRKANGVTRPQDRNGTLATFQTSRPYLAGLRKHFHAFRPLSVLFSVRERLVENYLTSLLEESPIQVHWNVQRRTSKSSTDVGELDEQVVEQVYSQRLDAVIVIDDDGQTCRIWDERARPVSPISLLRPLRELINRRRLAQSTRTLKSTVSVGGGEDRRQAPNWLQARAAFVRTLGTTDRAVKQTPVVVESPAKVREEVSTGESDNGISPIVVGDSALPDGASLGIDVVSARDTLEAMSRTMQSHESRLGVDWRGAFWFDESGPTSDALLTVARVLQLLSQSDHPLSRISAE